MSIISKLIHILIIIYALGVTSSCSRKFCDCSISDINQKQIDYKTYKDWPIWDYYDEKTIDSFNNEVYRLIIFPAFSEDDRLLYTLIKSSDEIKFTKKVISGRNNKESKVKESSKKIDFKLWNDFEQNLERSCVLSIASFNPKDKMVTDRKLYLFEAHIENDCNNLYNYIVARKSTKGQSVFFDACNKLIDLYEEN